MNSRLWVDITTLLSWRGSPTGIPRVAGSILSQWVKDKHGPELRFCAYLPARESFFEIAPEHARQVFDAISKNKPNPLLKEPDGRDSKRSKPDEKGMPQKKSRGRLGTFYHWLLSSESPLPYWFRAIIYEVVGTTICVVKQLWWLVYAVVGMIPRIAADIHMNVLFTRRSPRGADVHLVWRLPPESTLAAFSAGDVLFCPSAGWNDSSFTVAVRTLKNEVGIKFVPVVYDLIPCKLPQLFQTKLISVFQSWAREILPHSDLILAISESTKQDTIAEIRKYSSHVPPVEVIRLGDEIAPGQPSNMPAQLKGELAGRPFVLAVGTVEVRKNHLAAYLAWEKLIQSHGDRIPQLIIAGRIGWLTEDLIYQIENNPVVKGRIRIVEDLSDAELRWLYENCLFSIYPSLYEGWGLPVAECLSYGKFCITSNSSSLPEIGGSLVDYHEPMDFIELSRLVEKYVLNSDELAKREAAVRTNYQRTSWGDCAEQTMELLGGVGIRKRAADAVGLKETSVASLNTASAMIPVSK